MKRFTLTKVLLQLVLVLAIALMVKSFFSVPKNLYSTTIPSLNIQAEAPSRGQQKEIDLSQY
jgi:hypothetical protein